MKVLAPCGNVEFTNANEDDSNQRVGEAIYPVPGSAFKVFVNFHGQIKIEQESQRLSQESDRISAKLEREKSKKATDATRAKINTLQETLLQTQKQLQFLREIQNS